MKTLITSILLFMATGLSAQKPVELPLWPNGAPNDNGLKGEEVMSAPYRLTNVTQPTITVYRPATPNGMTIIMCPGGAYALLAMDHEGHDMAPWFNSLGITYVVLKYRMPNGHCEVPLSDAEQANTNSAETCQRLEYSYRLGGHYGSFGRRSSRLYPCYALQQ